jgi:hypothetical protein
MAQPEPSAELVKSEVTGRETFVRCLYNGPNGTSCVVGHLFRPEERAGLEEGMSVGADRIRTKVKDFSLDMLTSAQSLHDMAAEVWLRGGSTAPTWGQHLLERMKANRSTALSAVRERF